MSRYTVALAALAVTQAATVAALVVLWRSDRATVGLLWAQDGCLDGLEESTDRASEDADVARHAVTELVEDVSLLRLALHDAMPDVVDAPETGTLEGIMARRVPAPADGRDG